MSRGQALTRKHAVTQMPVWDCPAGNNQLVDKSTRRTAKRTSAQQNSARDHNDEEASAKAPIKSKAKAKKGAPKGRKGKSTSRVGLVDPTAEEMKTAFSMFNPHSRSVISSQDISRVSAAVVFTWTSNTYTMTVLAFVAWQFCVGCLHTANFMRLMLVAHLYES